MSKFHFGHLTVRMPVEWSSFLIMTVRNGATTTGNILASREHHASHSQALRTLCICLPAGRLNLFDRRSHREYAISRPRNVHCALAFGLDCWLDHHDARCPPGGADNTTSCTFSDGAPEPRRRIRLGRGRHVRSGVRSGSGACPVLSALFALTGIDRLTRPAFG